MIGLRELLPTDVRVVDRLDDAPIGSLHPLERGAIEGAVAARREEFATGRWCARAALSRLGVPVAPIPVGPDRAPVWPTGVVGSLTHCRGYRAAAVAAFCLFAGIGVDAEPADDIDDLLPDIATADELQRLPRTRHPDGDPPWSRLLFSAKESAFKAWFTSREPGDRRILDFTEMRVLFGRSPSRTSCPRQAHGTFSALAVDGTFLPGRWAVGDGLVLTAVALRRPDPPGR